MKLLILALVLKAVLSIPAELNDVVLDDPIVKPDEVIKPPINDLDVNMRTNPLKFNMNSGSNKGSKEEEEDRRDAAIMRRFHNYPHARQIKIGKREPSMKNKRNNQVEKRADNLKSARSLEHAIQVARSLDDKVERSFGKQIPMERSNVGRSNVERSIGDNMERSNVERSIGNNMERSNVERSIGNNMERSNVERSIGNNMERSNVERYIGNNMERSNVERSIGNNMERSNVERSIGNNMERSNVERSIGNNMERSNVERSIGNNMERSNVERSVVNNMERSLDDQIKRLKPQIFANDKAKKGDKTQKRQNYQREVTTWDEAVGFEISGRESKCRLPAETIDEALSVHQHFRTEEKAANMWLMEWDDTLADLAQGLADTCVFKHTNLKFSNGTRVGQNLGAVTGQNHSISRIVQLFVNEKNDYDYENHEWHAAVGHYLQVVYWQSVKVGCALKKCDTLYIATAKDEKVFNDAWYWVCDYWPQSSSKKRPFDQGVECSECVVPVRDAYLGIKCVEGNCLECVIDQSRPDFDPQCEKAKPCVGKEDAYTYCNYAKTSDWCNPSNRYYKWAKINCQATCDLCDLLPEKLDTIS